MNCFCSFFFRFYRFSDNILLREQEFIKEMSSSRSPSPDSPPAATNEEKDEAATESGGYNEPGLWGCLHQALTQMVLMFMD